MLIYISCTYWHYMVCWYLSCIEKSFLVLEESQNLSRLMKTTTLVSPSASFSLLMSLLPTLTPVYVYYSTKLQQHLLYPRSAGRQDSRLYVQAIFTWQSDDLYLVFPLVISVAHHHNTVQSTCNRSGEIYYINVCGLLESFFCVCRWAG